MFRVQSNVIVTRLRQRSLTQLRISSAILKQEFSPHSRRYVIVQRQNLVEDLPPLRNLLIHISTWLAATRVPFSKQEREPWVARKVQKVFSVGELIVLMLLTEQIRIKTMNS